MPLLKDAQISNKFQCLVYGRFKVGKTWGALSFPRPNVISFDKGMAVARNPEWLAKFGIQQFNSIMFEDFSESKKDKAGVVMDHTAFDNACRYFDEWMKPVGKWPGFAVVGREHFDTWVIDSGTTASEYALNKAIVLLGSKKLGIASQTHAQAINTGLVYPKMQDWGSERSMVEQFIDMVKDSGKNVVFICHEKELTNDEGIPTAIVPLLTGKGVDSVSLKFDEVYRLTMKRKGTDHIRALQTEPDGLTKCGSRYGVPNGTEWNWNAIQDAIKANQLKFKQLSGA